MLISVIVPIYKVEKYLTQCVDSILAQTHKDLEIILVDDGSPDGCGAMCDEYAKRDSRVRVIHKENGGLSDARNAGLAVCTGDYIGFVDSDDYIAPDMYETLAAFAEKEDLDVAMCGATDVWPDRMIKASRFNSVVLTNTDDIIYEIFVNPRGGHDIEVWDRIYRASRYKDVHFEKGRCFEDVYYMLPWIERTRRFGRLCDPKYFYRHHEGSITSERGRSTKTDDCIEGHEGNLKYICVHHPRSIPAGECRLWWVYRMVINQLEGSGDIYCTELAHLIRRDIGRIWRNPYVDLKAKVGYSLMAADVRLYYGARRLYRALKGKR